MNRQSTVQKSALVGSTAHQQQSQQKQTLMSDLTRSRDLTTIQNYNNQSLSTLLPAEEILVYRDLSSHQSRGGGRGSAFSNSKSSTTNKNRHYTTLKSYSSGIATINPLGKLKLKRKIIGASDLQNDQKELEFYLNQYTFNPEANQTKNDGPQSITMLSKSRNEYNQQFALSYSQERTRGGILTSLQQEYGTSRVQGNRNKGLSEDRSNIGMANQNQGSYQTIVKHPNKGDVSNGSVITSPALIQPNYSLITGGINQHHNQQNLQQYNIYGSNSTLLTPGNKQHQSRRQLLFEHQRSSHNKDTYHHLNSQTISQRDHKSRILNSKLSKLRFLMEENAIYKQESEAKIDEVIKNALKKEELLETREYLKLKKVIERLTVIGQQTKFELGFNLDMIFGSEYQESNHQNTSGIKDEEALKESANKSKQTNSVTKENFFSLTSNNPPQYFSQDNMVVVIDLLENLVQDMQNNKFDEQSYEIAKLIRVLMRQINEPSLNQLLFAISVWMIAWVDSVIKFQDARVSEILERTSQKTFMMKDQINTIWTDLEESVKQELKKKDKKIEELEQRYEKLRRDKEAVEDTLRHRNSEIQMLNRNPDYDQFKGLLGTLSNCLDECEEVSQEIDPQIESLNFLTKLLGEIEDKKKLEELKQSEQKQVRKVVIRRIKKVEEKQEKPVEKTEQVEPQQKVIMYGKNQGKSSEKEQLNQQQNKNEQNTQQNQQQQNQQISSKKSQNSLNKSPEPRSLEKTQNFSNNKNQSQGSTPQRPNQNQTTPFTCQKCGNQQQVLQHTSLPDQQHPSFSYFSNKNINQLNKSLPGKKTAATTTSNGRDMGSQTNLSLMKDPILMTIADQMLDPNFKRNYSNFGSNMNMKKVTTSKESSEIVNKSTITQKSSFFKSNQQFTIGNQGGSNKISDVAILKAIETAMEEMVRFEVSEQSPHQNHIKKIFEFREYLFDYLLTQYGLRNIAQKTYEYIFQRIYEFSERDFPYSKLLINALGLTFPDNQKSWTINKQHVCIYAMIIFNDAQNLTKSTTFRTDISPGKRVSRIDLNLIGDVYSQGGQVNIFDLVELMSKNHSENQVVLRTIENLKPGSLIEDEITSIDSEYQNETIFFELAQMKLTAKLARAGFDHKYFIETLDYKGKGRLKISKLLLRLKDRFSLHFSLSEKEALVRYFKPSNVKETSQFTSNYEQQVLMKEGPKPFTSLLLSQAEFQIKIKGYAISKSQFIQFVLDEYDEYTIELSKEINNMFTQFDKIYNRGGLNYNQFEKLMSQELKLYGQSQFTTSSPDNDEISKLFNDALEFLEENDSLKQDRLLGLSAVKDIIMERNLDSLPLYNYMKIKYNSGRRGSIRKAKAMINNNQFYSSDHMSPSNNNIGTKSQSPVRRNTIVLKRA